MAAVRHPGFSKVLNFNGDKIERVKVRHVVEFCSNQCNRFPDIVIYQFCFKMAALICYARIWTSHEEHLVVFIVGQNLVGIDIAISIICCMF